MFLLINSLLVLLNGGLQFLVLSFFLTPKKNRIQNALLYFLLLYITLSPRLFSHYAAQQHFLAILFLPSRILSGKKSLRAFLC